MPVPFTNWSMINDEGFGTKFPTSVPFTTWFVAVEFVPVALDCA